MLGNLNNEEIEQLLSSEVTGRIGCHADGKIYIVPITYMYDEGCIIGHSGAGMKIDMMRKNPEVCFEVDHMKNLSNWQSVIAWGDFEELTGKDAEDAMLKLVNKLKHLTASVTSMPTHKSMQPHDPNAKQTVIIYKIRLRLKTGRFEKR